MVIKDTREMILGLGQNARSTFNCGLKSTDCHASLSSTTAVADTLERSEVSERQEEIVMTSVFDTTKNVRSLAPIAPVGGKSKSLSPCPRFQLINAIERNRRHAIRMLWRQRESRQTQMPSQLTYQSIGMPPTTNASFTAYSARASSQMNNSLYILQSRTLSTQRFHPYNQSLPAKIASKDSDFHISRGRLQVPPSSSTENLASYFHPESSPSEDYLWTANFFGHSSVSQLTYTLVYLLGKILCLRSGVELRTLNLWNSLKLLPIHKLPHHNQRIAMEYELHYNLPPDPVMPSLPMYANSKRLLSLSERAKGNRFLVVLDHILIKTHWGFVIKHSVRNNHQKCLVCFHAMLLQKRNW